MENLKLLFTELMKRETNSSVKAAESMRAVWAVVKDRNDPFSVAIRNVIIEEMSKIRKTSNSVLRFHKEVFHGSPLDTELDDHLIDFLAAQEKQVKIAEEILREDLNLPTEP